MPVSSRRLFLGSAAALSASPALVSATPLVSAALVLTSGHSISFTNLHTREKLNFVFSGQIEVTTAMHQRFNQFLRDHYSGDIADMDPSLIAHLVTLQKTFEIRHAHFEVISGYRSPKTNEMLRKRGRRVARRSMHMSGQAIDIRLDGVKLEHLRDAALSLKAGGVGYYPKSRFLHFDTGRVRQW
jgi:uncharacterized protein YcbK (DUF882 family)